MPGNGRHQWNEFARAGWSVPIHSVRTALAAVASVLVARLFRLPEYYRAPITTLVITQSSLGAALTVSGQRLAGTAMGAAVGAIVAVYFGPHLFAFGIGVFILGPICALVRSGRSAYRFGGWPLCSSCRGLVPHGKSLFIVSPRFSSE